MSVIESLEKQIEDKDAAIRALHKHNQELKKEVASDKLEISILREQRNEYHLELFQLHYPNPNSFQKTFLDKWIKQDDVEIETATKRANL